jgi:hypothetical protein
LQVSDPSQKKRAKKRFRQNKNKNSESATRKQSRNDILAAKSQSRTAAEPATPKAVEDMSRQCRATEDKTRAGSCDVTLRPRDFFLGLFLFEREHGA